MTIDDLLLFPHDEIDYGSLDAEMLRALATQQYEPYIATSALAELGIRRDPEAHAAAMAILSGDLWDRHLFAFAITTLCDIDGPDAAKIMPTLLARINDPKILGAMVECVLLTPESFSADQGFLEQLAKKVEAIEPDEFTDLDMRSEFLARYRN